jgi:hypothetical protein
MSVKFARNGLRIGLVIMIAALAYLIPTGVTFFAILCLALPVFAHYIWLLSVTTELEE